MNMPLRRRFSRLARSFWEVLALLAAFAVVLVLVADRYLLPALRAAHAADPTARKHLAAVSSLVLVVVLVALLAILLVVLRPGRLFFPRKPTARTQTRYPDAWAESGRRMETPPEENDEQ